MMSNTMFEKVDTLLEKYIGGQIFFTELDKAVKFDIQILTDLINAVSDTFGTSNTVTISSGEIGLAMHNYGLPVDILVPGGLRFDPEKINLKPFTHILADKNVIFIDDSYFSGRTLTVVKEEVERCGGTFAGALVAYDGSKMKDPLVKSLYRYYDYHDVLGRPLNKETGVKI